MSSSRMMHRSRNIRRNNRLVETSFDSRTFSSAEDLDEVDRLANHPVLRSAPPPLWQRGYYSSTLRKSRSETEDRLCNPAGLSVWSSSVSNQGSPTANAAGCSIPRSRGMLFNDLNKLSRSTTVGANLNASPISSAPGSWVYQEEPQQQQQQQQEQFEGNSFVVRAVIETTTPPNTAPLPNKFGRVVQVDLQSNLSSPPAADREQRLRSLRSRLKLERGMTGGGDSSSADSTPQRLLTQSNQQHLVRRGAEVVNKPLVLAPKPVLELSAKGSKFFSSGESSCCSSAMSSLESIQSVVSSSESGAVSSMSSHSSDVSSCRPSLELRGHKQQQFQILSPISDKSQEQCSSSETDPKVSPVVDNNQSSSNNNNNVNDNEKQQQQQQLRDVPWEMPKLRRRLHHHHHQAENLNEQLRGSDSGISIASQQEQDIKELLNVPWDMPKLRKKTEQIFSLGGITRPQSLPAAASSSEQLRHLEESAPPPPGFEDSGDEFYLSQSQAAVAAEEPLLRKAKRQRPKMTLSFGVDPSLKTLMFATNSPFSLNDCEEVDPNLPLDRQDWYHGAVTRIEAENILRSHQEGSYLVRNVDSARQEFALSLKSAKGFMHMRIRRDPQNRDFRLSDFPRQFITVSQMVHHYTRNRLPIRGAEHMCLKRPIREQLL